MYEDEGRSGVKKGPGTRVYIFVSGGLYVWVEWPQETQTYSIRNRSRSRNSENPVLDHFLTPLIYVFYVVWSPKWPPKPSKICISIGTKSVCGGVTLVTGLDPPKPSLELTREHFLSRNFDTGGWWKFGGCQGCHIWGRHPICGWPLGCRIVLWGPKIIILTLEIF